MSKDDDTTKDCLPFDFKYDTVADFKPIFEVCCMTVIFLSILILFLSLKWRRLLNYIIYFDNTFIVLCSFIPSDQADYNNIAAFYMLFMSLIFFYTEVGSQIIFISAVSGGSPYCGVQILRSWVQQRS